MTTLDNSKLFQFIKKSYLQKTFQQDLVFVTYNASGPHL